MIVFTLRDYLKRQGITEHHLMRKLNVRPDTFYRFCNNELRRIPVDFLDKVCSELKIQPGEIIKWMPDERL